MYQKAREAFQRFPLVVIDACIGTIIGIILVDGNIWLESESLLVRLLLTLILGFPLFLSVYLYSERHKWTTKKQSMVTLGALVFLVGYFLLLPDPIQSSPSKHFFRFMLYALGFTVSVSFAPFIEGESKKSFFRWPWKTRNELNGFWQYCKTLVERFVITGVFTGVLFIGLAIALAAVENLLDVYIPSELYPQLWVFIVGIIATWFFISGIPKDFMALEKKTDYHQLIKRFSQYILMPLVGVYAVILYIYTAKIMVTWDWPKGMVSFLIIGFAVCGFAAYVLLYPLREQKEYLWVHWFRKVFFSLLIPQALVLLYAVWLRISAYGLTENRYFLVVIGVWLIAMAVYFLRSKRQNIKAIPLSIFAICLLVSVGPWGAMGLSELCQVNRLQDMFIEHGILENGKVKKTQQEVTKTQLQQMSSTLDYLNSTHGLESIQPWFDQDLENIQSNNETKIPQYSRPEYIMEDILGLTYVTYWELNYRSEDGSFYLHSNENVIQTTGYDYIQNMHVWGGGYNPDIVFDVENSKYTLQFDLGKYEMRIMKEDVILATTDLQPFFESIYERYVQPDSNNQMVENVSVEYIENGARIKLYFLSINGQKQDENLVIDGFSGYVLFGATQ